MGGGVSPADTLTIAERRHDERVRDFERHRISAVKVRPGIQATLLDLSAGGAALETVHRLLPGRFVHVQFSHGGQGTTVRARVLRTEVSWLTAGIIAYRCAVQFDRPWTFAP